MTRLCVVTALSSVSLATALLMSLASCGASPARPAAAPQASQPAYCETSADGTADGTADGSGGKTSADTSSRASSDSAAHAGVTEQQMDAICSATALTGQLKNKTIAYIGIAGVGAFARHARADIQRFVTAGGFSLTTDHMLNSNDPLEQVSAFDKAISARVAAIILYPAEQTGWQEELEKARVAGIPVIVVGIPVQTTHDDHGTVDTTTAGDTTASGDTTTSSGTSTNADTTTNKSEQKADGQEAPLVASFIGPSDEWAGEQAAEYVNSLNSSEKGAKLTGLVISGALGSPQAQGREKGWESKLSSSVRVVETQHGDWTRQSGHDLTADILARHPSTPIDFIFAANDSMAIGASQAAQEAGITPQIISIDGTRAGLQALVNGSLSRVIEYNPQMGVDTLHALTAVLGHRLDPEKYPTIPRVYRVPSQIFTAASARAALAYRKY
ncbi:substrate-binding domain-containing protein [Aeriscardovia aeriphila]|uniref:Sugar ABC transporter substrate-binding protein n=1 Tax=Aeriscardovia aeriphila TaxID=218139 RepID=A0A261FAR4_9BIFI|nr:substrate-binding domain-containing protein [Aeriscardovia aeriphila]NYI25725.1 simple sugar transport system substrate-binding protein [Aeriscardovia aeriphila]OZG56125.1 sugar ABC transporter substrate-binding protein [Aeriscardovia aeriphila]